MRYSGISFVYQFTAIFASGMTPMVATMLTGMADGAPWYLCGYLAGIGLLSALSTLWLSRMARARRNAQASKTVTQTPKTAMVEATSAEGF